MQGKLAAVQSVLDPQGPAAAAIAQLSRVLLIGGGAILLLVLAATAYALWAQPARRAWLSQERDARDIAAYLATLK